MGKILTAWICRGEQDHHIEVNTLQGGIPWEDYIQIEFIRKFKDFDHRTRLDRMIFLTKR